MRNNVITTISISRQRSNSMGENKDKLVNKQTNTHTHTHTQLCPTARAAAMAEAAAAAAALPAINPHPFVTLPNPFGSARLGHYRMMRGDRWGDYGFLRRAEQD